MLYLAIILAYSAGIIAHSAGQSKSLAGLVIATILMVAAAACAGL
jgi:hypothetical protein